jgi:surface polysaccharide O-acyltransferase-like enzyme
MISEPKLSSSRQVYLDFLRILAAFAVVFQHVAASRWFDTPVKSLDWQIMNVYHSLQLWAVPVFVMISGSLHLQESNYTGFNNEIKILIRKIFRLICALAFWSILYNVVFPSGRLYFKKGTWSIIDLIKIPAIIIFGPAWGHLWYLYMLFGLYLLTPIIRCFISSSTKKHIEYLLLLFCIYNFFLLYNSLLSYIPVSRKPAIFLPIQELSGYAGYFIAGLYFSKHQLSKKIKAVLYILAVFSVLFTISGTSLISINNNKPIPIISSYTYPNVIFYSFGIFVFFKEIFANRQFNAAFKRMLESISKKSFGVYLVHAFILQTFINSGFNVFSMNIIISIPFITLLVIIISYIFTFCMKKIPLLKFVV